MDTKTDPGTDALTVIGRPEDTESFREAVEVLLTRAAENGVVIDYTSWKCVSDSGTAWEVEITPVEQS